MESPLGCQGQKKEASLEAVRSSVGVVIGLGSLETVERGKKNTFGVCFGSRAHER